MHLPFLYAPTISNLGQAIKSTGDLEQLEQLFNLQMIRLYERIKEETGYNAKKFHTMISTDGGLATAQTLITALKAPDGYTNLWERGRLDLTVEKFVLSHKEFHPLFTQAQLDACLTRLAEYEGSATS